MSILKILGEISFVGFLILMFFNKRIIRYLGFEPCRMRDLLGYFSLIFLPITVNGFIANGLFLRNIEVYIAGLIIGVPITIIGNHFYFKRVKDNVLYPPTGKHILPSVLIGTLISDAMVFIALRLGYSDKEISGKIVALAWGICSVGLIGILVDVIRYEKKHGRLYFQNKSAQKPKGSNR